MAFEKLCSLGDALHERIPRLGKACRHVLAEFDRPVVYQIEKNKISLRSPASCSLQTVVQLLLFCFKCAVPAILLVGV